MAAIVYKDKERSQSHTNLSFHLGPSSYSQSNLLSKLHFQEAVSPPQNLHRVGSMNPRDSRALPPPRENYLFHLHVAHTYLPVLLSHFSITKKEHCMRCLFCVEHGMGRWSSGNVLVGQCENVSSYLQHPQKAVMCVSKPSTLALR